MVAQAISHHLIEDVVKLEMGNHHKCFGKHIPSPRLSQKHYIWQEASPIAEDDNSESQKYFNSILVNITCKQKINFFHFQLTRIHLILTLICCVDYPNAVESV